MAFHETTTQVQAAALSDRIEQQEAGSCRLITLRTPVEDVVSFRGSFLASPDFGAGEELVQDLTVSLLDKGTKKRDRFAIADLLENKGAQLRFNSDGLRVRFSGRVLREDLGDVMAILAEQLTEPLFDEEEFAKAIAQQAAALRHSLESTGAQASGALSRQLYTERHPNYTRSVESELSRLHGITPDHIRQYHLRHFGANELTLVLVGDVDGDAAGRVVRESFGVWSPNQVVSAFEVQPTPQAGDRVEINMPDKSNVDVRMGHPVTVLRQDTDYLRLYVANYVLGGNFSARLMATVRDEMGLTYGIHSGLSGITNLYAGHWYVSVTLSRGTVDRGIDATMDQVRRFVEGGISQDELGEKQTTITGSYKVGLGTTGGLAATLLNNIEQGLGIDYVDRYPAEVEALTLDEVNEAIRQHFRPDEMRMALAGTL